MSALMNLQHGAPIDGHEWVSIIKNIPSKYNGAALLEHGTKTKFESMKPDDAQEAYQWVMLDELGSLGAMPVLREWIKTGQWQMLVDGSHIYADAVARWGHDAIVSPSVRVSTVHGAKGSEADNVAVVTSLPRPCWTAMQTDGGFDEEMRVAYVACTRAKKRLVIVDEAKQKWKWEL